MKNISVKIQKINKILADHFGIPKRQNPLPNPLDTLIATILSQNTNDNNSYKAFNNLKNSFKNWAEASNAKRSTIESLIRIAGLAPAKSKAIKNLLVKLSKSSSNLSLDFLQNFSNEEAIGYLTNYDGIGVKTASCVLLFSLDRNVCPVDTHVHRVLNRIGIVKTKSAGKTFLQINKKFPDGIAHSFHTNLIKLGREVCTPSKPHCKICPLKKICTYKEKNFEEKVSLSNNRILLLDNIGI